MTASSPKVSILVPCFNDGRHLDEALASIAAQRFDDFEVVIADDASTDDTLALAATWAARDPRFRVVRNSGNLGMTENWNRALDEARGDLVTKLDGDDALEPSFLADLVGELDADPTVTVAFCRTLDCDERLTPLVPFAGDDSLRLAELDPEMRYVRPGLEWLRIALEGQQLWTSNAQLHRRRELHETGGWDARWLSSDQELILRVLERDRPVVHHPGLAVRYRRRVGSHRHGVVARGWGALESVLLPLRTIDRVRTRPTFRLTKRVRFNWWRLWVESRNIGRNRSIHDDLPLERRRLYQQTIGELRPPPLIVRLEGWARLYAWRFFKSPATGAA